MRRDPHSYADDAQPAVEHLVWDVDVDFASKTLACTATLRLGAGGGDAIDLDTRELAVESVDDGAAPLRWELAPAEPILGARLRVALGGARRVRMRYRTS